MTDLELRIDVDGTVYTYTDLDMGEGSVETARAYRDGQVEADDVTVTLDRPGVCGWTSLLEMPSDLYRADLRDAVTGEVLMDGTLHRTGLSAGDPAPTDALRRWEVRLIDSALDDLMEGLASVSLRSAAGYVEGLPDGALDRDAWMHYEGGDVQLSPIRWWSARGLLEGALRLAGALDVVVPPLFGGAFRYLDGAGVEQRLEIEDRGYVADVRATPEGEYVSTAVSTIPDVSGREWWDLLSGLVGLSLTVRYEPWPSAGLVATVSRDRWEEPSAEDLAVLDLPGAERLVLDGWAAECETAPEPEFSIQFGNDLDERSLGDGVALDVASRYASARSVYISGIGDAGDEVALRQPRVKGISDVASDGYRRVFGESYLDMAVSEPYLAYLTGAGAVPLTCYEITTPPAGGVACYNPTWASMLYAGHALSASDVLRVEVDVDLDALEAAGAPAPELLATQYEIEGAGWRTEEIAVDADSRRGRLALVRPALGYATEAAPVRVGPPQLTTTRRYYTGQVDGQYIYSTEDIGYASPGPGLSRASRIEVEHSVGTEPAWPGTPGGYVIYSSNNDLDVAPRVHFRARAHYDDSAFVSDWVYV